MNIRAFLEQVCKVGTLVRSCPKRGAQVVNYPATRPRQLSPRQLQLHLSTTSEFCSHTPFIASTWYLIVSASTALGQTPSSTKPDRLISSSAVSTYSQSLPHSTTLYSMSVGTNGLVFVTAMTVIGVEEEGSGLPLQQESEKGFSPTLNITQCLLEGTNSLIYRG